LWRTPARSHQARTSVQGTDQPPLGAGWPVLVSATHARLPG